MRLKIQYKITLLIALIVTTIFTSLFVYLKTYLREFNDLRINSTIAREIALAKSYLEKTFRNDLSIEKVDQLADKIGHDLKLRVTIIGLNGKVLGDSDLSPSQVNSLENHLYRPEVQQALKDPMGKSHRFSTTIKEDMIYFATRFGAGGDNAIVRLAMPVEDVEALLTRLKKLLLNSFLFAIVLSILLGFVASYFISQPIQYLSKKAKDIANGNLESSIIVNTNDEIEDLAKAFNFMIEQIKQRINEVYSGKSRLEAVFLSMFEGVMILNAQGKILLMNKALKDFLHVTQEPMGRGPLEVIRNIEIQDIADQVLKFESGVASKEISVFLPEEKTLLIHATPVVREGICEGAVLIFHDISDLRQLENVRRDFVANVSHELRTPLASIKGYAETLIDGALEDKENARDFLQIICSDADRLAKLVNDLLDLSRIESGKTEFAFASCSLETILSRVLLALDKKAKEKAILIKREIPSHLPQVRVDEPSISQVFLNLIENAIKYNKLRGTITISAKEKDSLIEVSISDTGIGIPKEDLPRIFERFYRVDKARSRQLGGTGLGLSIVKHIIQAHQGEVSVQSELDSGSVFTFTLLKA